MDNYNRGLLTGIASTLTLIGVFRFFLASKKIASNITVKEFKEGFYYTLLI